MSIFNKRFIDPTPPYFGLDMSELSIKVLQMTHKGRYDSVYAFASEKIASGLIDNRDIKNIDAIVSAIKKVRKKAGISTKNVICSLPESKAFIRIVTIPQMKKKLTKKK